MYFTDVFFLIRIVMYCMEVVFLIRIVMYCMDVVFTIRIVMYFTDVVFRIRTVMYCTSVSILIVMFLISVVCFSPRLWCISILLCCSSGWNHIGGVMVSFPASSLIDRGFECRTGQTKYYEIDIWLCTAEHSALRRKSKYWLVRDQDTMSEWGDMSILGLLFQSATTIKI